MTAQTAATSANLEGWQRTISDLLNQAGEQQSPRCPFCGAPLASVDLNCTGCGESLRGLMYPPLHESYFREAHEQFAAGSGAEALETVALCLRLRPDHGPALRLKAGLLALGGRLREAEAFIAKAQAAMPHDPETAALAYAIARGARERRSQASHPEMSRSRRPPRGVGCGMVRDTGSDWAAQRKRLGAAALLAGVGLVALTAAVLRYLARKETDRIPGS